MKLYPYPAQGHTTRNSTLSIFQPIACLLINDMTSSAPQCGSSPVSIGQRPPTLRLIKQNAGPGHTCFVCPVQCFPFFKKLPCLYWGRHSPSLTPLCSVGLQQLNSHIYLLCDTVTESVFSVAPQFDTNSYSIPRSPIFRISLTLAATFFHQNDSFPLSQMA